MTFLRLGGGAAANNSSYGRLSVARFLLFLKGKAFIIFPRYHSYVFKAAFANRSRTLCHAYKIPRLCRNGAQGKLQACVNVNAPFVHCPAAYLSGHSFRFCGGNAALAYKSMAKGLNLPAKAEFAFFRNIVYFYTDVS